MRILLGIIVAFFSFFIKAFAAGFPFVDVPLGSQYYPAINSLYSQSIISDDGSHKFRPGDPLTRDMFAGLLMGTACDSCLSPTIEDTVKYQTSPLPDLSKDNPYYYCIARAFDEKSINGIALNPSGKSVCKNGNSYDQIALCNDNTTTRIEGAVSLLKKANLWNDTLNSSVVKTLTINDVDTYSFGYAQKAIELGMLSLDAAGNIKPDTPLTRGEFTNMASKIFEFVQCVPPSSVNKIWSNIQITSDAGAILKQSIISKDTPFTLNGASANTSGVTFSWKAIESTTGNIVTFNGQTLSSTSLGVGTWYVNLSVYDKTTGEKLSNSVLTLTISPEAPGNLASTIAPPSVYLMASPLTPAIGGVVNLTAKSQGKEPIQFSWDFGDGNRSKSVTDSTLGKDGSKKSYTYTAPGSYVISVMMIDADGNTALGSTVVEVGGKGDTDGDGVDDSIDACPEIKGPPSSKGCPTFSTNIYTLGVFLSPTGGTSMSSPSSATGSATTDTDGDGISDALDACPTTPGNAANSGCPGVGSFLGNVERNSCVMDQIQITGGIIIEPICESCPCPNTISMGTSLRKCDVIFPAILSKDLLTIYSRGPLFQIP